MTTLNGVRAVAGFYHSMWDPYSVALRVAKWHTRIFGQPPTVVIRVYERSLKDPSIDVAGLARLLMDHGLRVVVDCSDNTLRPTHHASAFPVVLDVEEMPRAVLESMPELQRLLRALREAGLADLVWTVLGGSPASYRLLNTSWKCAKYGDVTPVAEDHMHRLLCIASHNMIDATVNNKLAGELFARFKNETEVSSRAIEEFGTTHATPDKVLRLRRKAGSQDEVLVPLSPKAGLFLRYGTGCKSPSLDDLRQVIAAQATATDSSEEPRLQ